MPARRKDDRLREQILKEAATEFARVGFRSASLRTICARAKSNVALVQYYFGGKTKLYRAVIESAHHRLTGAVERPPTQPDDPVEMLRFWTVRAVTMIFRKGSEEKLFARITLHELSDPTPMLEPIIQALGKPMCDELVIVLCRVMRCEPSDPRVSAAVPMIFGLCMHPEHAQVFLDRLGYPAPKSAEAIDRFAQRIANFVIAGVLDLAFDGRKEPS